MLMRVMMVCSLFALIACNGGKNKTNIEMMDDMMDQISVKAQDYDPDRRARTAMMVPPANTVAQNRVIYAYKGDPVAAEANLVNPLASDFSPQVIEMGKGRYEIYCKVCHGSSGHGDGQIADKMILRPPSVVSDKVKGFRDGRIFHIITEGQGLMGSYAGQITDEKMRWAVVNYIRTLQRSSNKQ